MSHINDCYTAPYIMYVAINISFSKSSYIVKESLGQVQLELLLTGSYPAAFTVKVQSRDITASGRHFILNGMIYYKCAHRKRCGL